MKLLDCHDPDVTLRPSYEEQLCAVRHASAERSLLAE
jgi:hypothetical protein